MKDRTSGDRGGKSRLPWEALLTMLALLCIVAFLVTVMQWDYVDAIERVGGVFLASVAAIAATLFMVTPREDRRELLDLVVQAMREDWDGLLSVISGKW
jgi:protein-S-isoprenylcysteine O-methyltransferase Ste14